MVDRKYYNPSLEPCIAPIKPSGLLIHNKNYLNDVTECVNTETFEWDGTNENSTETALKSIDEFLKEIEGSGGKVVWSSREDASVRYFGLIFNSNYYFVAQQNVGLNTYLTINSTDIKY